MVRLVSDESFNGHILHGLETRLPGLDLIRVTEEPLRGIKDSDLLVWAARQGRVILTHDRKTLVPLAEPASRR